MLPELLPDLVAEPPILRAPGVDPAYSSDIARAIPGEWSLLLNPGSV